MARLDRGKLNSTNTGIVSGTEDFTQAWALDPTGNWSTFNQADTGGAWTLQQTRTANATNEITGITGGGWIVPAYDVAGNMVTMPQAAAPSTADNAKWDAWNRMVTLSSGGSTIEQNAFDGENRRATKLVSGTTRHYYYSSDWQSLEERLGSASSAERQFVWGQPYIDDLVLRDCGSERFYAFQDPNWNVTGICGPAGTIAERYAYSAYGKPVFLSSAFTVIGASGYGWETLYAGYRFNAESNLYMVRRRLLQPLLGTWTSRDPERDAPRLGWYRRLPTAQAANGEFNAYQYASGNPAFHVDPSGASALRTDESDEQVFSRFPPIAPPRPPAPNFKPHPGKLKFAPNCGGGCLWVKTEYLALPFLRVIPGEFGPDAAGQHMEIGHRPPHHATVAVHVEHQTPP